MATRPNGFANPLRWTRWFAHEKPAYFWSFVIAGMGPASYLYAPPLRRLFNDTIDPMPIPLTYPIPKGPRNIPKGYDDE